MCWFSLRNKTKFGVRLEPLKAFYFLFAFVLTKQLWKKKERRKTKEYGNSNGILGFPSKTILSLREISG